MGKQEKRREIIMWGTITLVLGALTLAAIIYLSTRIPKFPSFAVLFSSPHAAIIGGTVTVCAVLAVLYFALGIMDTIVVLLHAVAAWLLCEGLARLLHIEIKLYAAGIAALLLCVCVLSLGWIAAHRVVRTQYSIGTGKKIGAFTVVGFSDSHIGAIFDGDGLDRHIDRMNSENADVAVIVGDFVDDDTKHKDMVAACRALSRLKAKYGVYFVFGNHDPGFSPQHRGYSKEDLKAELIKNGIHVLEDELVNIRDNIFLCGRQDKSVHERADIRELASGVSDTDCLIVLDHQPGDFAAEEDAGCSLVLCGHTHGGQMFPANLLMGFFNDMVYGHEKRGSTDFIVSSGIADWALDFKTLCKSEYFVIDLH